MIGNIAILGTFFFAGLALYCNSHYGSHYNSDNKNLILMMGMLFSIAAMVACLLAFIVYY